MKRRRQLDNRRVADAQYTLPPIEPTPTQARGLYREMLKMASGQLRLTDMEYFRTKVRYEFEVTSRMTSARVRGIMYEKGKWMLKNDLGGIQ